MARLWQFTLFDSSVSDDGISEKATFDPFGASGARPAGKHDSHDESR